MYSTYKLQIKSLCQGHMTHNYYMLHAECKPFYSVIFSQSLSTVVHLLELNIIIIVIVMRKRFNTAVIIPAVYYIINDLVVS